jgi:leucyl-tRNA synthetase
VHRETGQPLTPVRVAGRDAEKQGESFVLKSDPSIRLESRAYKMSKSRGNVVNPDAVVSEYGADSLRLYEMFMGPLEATKPWSMEGVNGVHGFLNRVWRMIVDERQETLQRNPAVQGIEPTDEQNRLLHKTIEAVTRDLESMDFNTGIARMMEFVNFFTKQSTRPCSVMESFVLLLSPFAPHIAEELWQLLGHKQTLAYEPWPAFDAALTKDDVIEIPVQVKGKLRGRILVPADMGQAELEEAAKTDEKIASFLEGRQIVKTIVVPGRLVNFVVR